MKTPQCQDGNQEVTVSAEAGETADLTNVSGKWMSSEMKYWI